MCISNKAPGVAVAANLGTALWSELRHRIPSFLEKTPSLPDPTIRAEPLIPHMCLGFTGSLTIQ